MDPVATRGPRGNWEPHGDRGETGSHMGTERGPAQHHGGVRGFLSCSGTKRDEEREAGGWNPGPLEVRGALSAQSQGPKVNQTL